MANLSIKTSLFSPISPKNKSVSRTFHSPSTPKHKTNGAPAKSKPCPTSLARLVFLFVLPLQGLALSPFEGLGAPRLALGRGDVGDLPFRLLMPNETKNYMTVNIFKIQLKTVDLSYFIFRIFLIVFL